MDSANAAAAGASPPEVAWLLERADVSDEGRESAAAATDVDALLLHLTAGGHVTDALRVVAAALPPREGIWWAWASATHAARVAADKAGTEPMLAALAATEQWIAAPDDAKRRTAWAAADAAGTDSPAGCTAAAVYFVTGSIGPADIPPIPPPAGLHVTMVGLAAILAAAVDTAHFEALAGAYIKQGLEVIKQLGGWRPSVELARAHFELQRTEHAKVTAPPKAPPAQAN